MYQKATCGYQKPKSYRGIVVYGANVPSHDPRPTHLLHGCISMTGLDTLYSEKNRILRFRHPCHLDGRSFASYSDTTSWNRNSASKMSRASNSVTPMIALGSLAPILIPTQHILQPLQVGLQIWISATFTMQYFCHHLLVIYLPLST